MTKSIGLISGGLDSILSVCVIRDQGIEVQGITFETPFFSSANAQHASQLLGIPLMVMDITREHIAMLKNPPHGYGKYLNPCIDCHSLMLRCAGNLMKELSADFLFTGEVLGERPMSQNRAALDVVARSSGFAEYILRPLSAQLLPETRPERDGLVDRSRLLDINGRCRKRQMNLAQKYGITTYQTPAGGCLLTYEGYCKKLKDLLLHEPDAPYRYYRLLKCGRHFRLPEGQKLIAGRDMHDNNVLISSAQPEDIILTPLTHKGPVGIIPDARNELDLILACRIIASYCKSNGETPISVVWKSCNISKIITVNKTSSDEFQQFLITLS